MVSCAVSRFPRDKFRKRQWELAVNREKDWSATTSSAICSDHFMANDFYITEGGLRKLSTDAVPTINISPCQPLEPTIRNIEPIDIKATDSDEVIKLRFKVRRLEVIAENRKRRLNLMSQQNKRLHKKLEQIKCMMKHLIKVKVKG